MKKPTYTDPEQVASSMRASFERARVLIPKDLDEETRRLVQIQINLEEAQVSFMMESIRCANERYTSDIVAQGFGAVIGGIIGRLAAATQNPELFLKEVVGSSLSSAVSILDTGADNDRDGVRSDFIIAPIIGGNA